jgi:xanthine dehydrogenase accessory factor
MNDNEYVARIISERLSAGTFAVLASIISVQGSSPRHNGSKMVICEDEKSYGTIGGSLLEGTAIKEAVKVLKQKQSRFMVFDLAGKDAAAVGMICGGKVTVLLDYVIKSESNLEFFKTWHQTVLQRRDFYLVTQLREEENHVNIIGRSIMFPDGNMTGQIELHHDDLNNLKQQLSAISTTSNVTIGDTQIIIDPVRNMKTVYLFGAGHVSLPAAHIAALVGFRTIILDDRSEYANSERFPGASEIRVLKSFDQAFAGLDINSDSFIVILTRSHQFDREVLEQALQTKAGYIGMISSQRKRSAIYQALMDQGIKSEELARVHSPIGVAIGGETPEEIAVSIVAELISQRSKQKINLS